MLHKKLIFFITSYTCIMQTTFSLPRHTRVYYVI